MLAASFTPPLVGTDGDATFPTAAVTTAGTITVDFGAGASAAQTVVQAKELLKVVQAAIQYIKANT